MKVRKPLLVAVAAAAAVLLPLRAAHAGQAYTSTIVEDDSNPGTVHLKGCTPKASQGGGTTITPVNCPAGNSVKFAPSTKKGDGGTVITLKLSNVLCNGSPCNTQNNVLELWSRALGTDTPGPSNPVIISSAGVLFNLVNGKAAFVNSGKPVQAGGPAFGILVSAIFTHSLGIGLIKIHEPASDPTACSFPPLLSIAAPSNNNHPGTGCIDGNTFAVAGIGIPLDPKYLCTQDSDCPTITQTCQPVAPGQSICQNEQCTTDGGCRSGHCNINSGTCCDPTAGTCD